MSIKLILYIIMVPISMWAVESLNIESYFKKNRRAQIITFYVIISLALAYLTVNFLYDFYDVSKLID